MNTLSSSTPASPTEDNAADDVEMVSIIKNMVTVQHPV
jgi:hypothetical protein